jgi:hypothetical protein
MCPRRLVLYPDVLFYSHRSARRSIIISLSYSNNNGSFGYVHAINNPSLRSSENGEQPIIFDKSTRPFFITKTTIFSTYHRNFYRICNMNFLFYNMIYILLNSSFCYKRLVDMCNDTGFRWLYAGEQNVTYIAVWVIFLNIVYLLW